MTSRALHEAIDYASHERLRMTLKAICEKSAIVRELVGHELMVDSRSSSEEPIFHASSATSFPSVLLLKQVYEVLMAGVILESIRWSVFTYVYLVKRT